MRVSVVVPTYCRPDLLARCLRALAVQDLAPGEYEVIVVDDAADEATRRLVESIAAPAGKIRYLAVTGNHGPAAARNVGWRASAGQIIAFTDDDCVPDVAWLSHGTRPFVNPSVVAVTGTTIVPLPSQPTDFERNLAGLEHSEFITANCFCRRNVLTELGGFDERFTTAWREDSDLHFRLLDGGGQVVRVSSAVVVHPVRQAVWGASLREQRKSLFDALLFRKHPRRFRERIRPIWPANYYVMLLCVIVALAAAIAGWYLLALASVGAWLVLVTRFCLLRLRHTSRKADHVAEMVVTSACIPFLSIYWRLRGALRFRVVFW